MQRLPCRPPLAYLRPAKPSKDRCVPGSKYSSLTFALASLLSALLAPSAQAADWKPAEQIKTYAVTGNSGAALYDSIGERGPMAGVQAIAHTTFKLTWRREYRPQPDGACVLATARPNLTIGEAAGRRRGELENLHQRSGNPRAGAWRAHRRHGEEDRSL